MISLNTSQIPLYLRKSDFFLALDEDDSNFDVPISCYKSAPTVSDDIELRALLSTLQFWGEDQCPKELIHYCLQPHDRHTSSILREYTHNLHFAGLLADVVSFPERSPIDIAYEWGDISIIKYFEDSSLEATDPVAIACANDHLHCMKHARSKGYPWSAGICEVAVQRGHLECLQYAIKDGCFWKITSNMAASIGASWANTHAREHLKEGFGLCSCSHANNEIDKKRHKQCLEYAHKGGYYWGTVILLSAAQSGHLDCIEYAHTTGCAWSVNVTTLCVEGGHLQCLKYCVENGCPFDVNGALQKAALSGHVHLVPYLLSHGAQWLPSVTTAAIEGGHLNFLVYAMQHQCKLHVGNVVVAAETGNMTALRLLDEHGVSMDSALAYRRAAMEGHWDCCDYLLNRDCSMPWSHVLDCLLRLLAVVAIPKLLFTLLL